MSAMMTTPAPNTTARNERIEIGRPENGARIVSTPSEIRTPERDMKHSIPHEIRAANSISRGESGSHDDHKFPSNSIGVLNKMGEKIAGRTRDNFFVDLGEFAGDSDI